MQKVFSDMISEIFRERFKPLGWKKQGLNFRYIDDTGLGKIINFQKSKWNTEDWLYFKLMIQNAGTLLKAAFGDKSGMDALLDEMFYEYNDRH